MFYLNKNVYLNLCKQIRKNWLIFPKKFYYQKGLTYLIYINSFTMLNYLGKQCFLDMKKQLILGHNIYTVIYDMLNQSVNSYE